MKLFFYFLITVLFSFQNLYSQNTVANVPASSLPDSVVVPASYLYGNASFLRRLFVGTNYRDEWAQPVKMAVFNIREQNMRITELGGGQQTKSLRLKDENGKEWVLRTVDKTVDKALKGLQKVFAKPLVQDMISAAYPYAPLTVAYLAKAADIVAPDPVLYYVPNDPALGQYREIFNGKVCFLEEREPTLTKNADTEGTDEVLEEIVEEDDHIVLQKTVLKARLLDMLIADWDRHADQWRWGKIKQDGDVYYYAIPRDRDQAFFMGTGLVPYFAKHTFMPHIGRFTENSNALKSLNTKAWTFDKTFLNELGVKEWEAGIKEFQNDLSDNVIEAAVKRMPPEIYAISGKEIEQKLKNRRDGLMKHGMDYYRFISARVQLNGRDEEDVFKISNKDGDIEINQWRLKKSGKQGAKIYSRTFNHQETKVIYIVGNKSNDQFIIDEDVNSPIKLKIYGGEGKDVYDLKGNIKSEIYDTKSEDNKILAKKRAEIDFK